MSTEKIIGNLGAVKREFSDMLESLSAVKGQDYADCVHQLLNVLQVQDMTGLLVRASRKVIPEEVINALADGLSMVLSTMVGDYITAKGLEPNRAQEMIDDAERIKASMNGLFKSAINAGQNGISMEG